MDKLDRKIIMEDGKIKNEDAIRAIKSLKDGNYVFCIIPLKPKTADEHRRLFFYKLKGVCAITDDTFSSLYTLFKNDTDIASTANLNVEEWESVQLILSNWIFHNLGILI